MKTVKVFILIFMALLVLFAVIPTTSIDNIGEAVKVTFQFITVCTLAILISIKEG